MFHPKQYGMRFKCANFTNVAFYSTVVFSPWTVQIFAFFSVKFAGVLIEYYYQIGFKIAGFAVIFFQGGCFASRRFLYFLLELVASGVIYHKRKRF
jgi:hypothetical protein